MKACTSVADMIKSVLSNEMCILGIIGTKLKKNKLKCRVLKIFPSSQGLHPWCKVGWKLGSVTKKEVKKMPLIASLRHGSYSLIADGQN